MNNLEKQNKTKQNKRHKSKTKTNKQLKHYRHSICNIRNKAKKIDALKMYLKP